MAIEHPRLDRTALTGRFLSRRFAVDVGVAVFIAIIAVIVGLTADSSVDGASVVGPSAFWHWPLMIGSTFLVPFRRIVPTTALALGAVVQAGTWLTDLPDLFLGTSVLLFSAAAYGGVRGRWSSLTVSVLLTGFACLGVLTDSAPLWVIPIIGLYSAVSTALGVGSANRQAYTEEVEARAADLERSQDLDRDRALMTERARIARELHDVVAHGLSVIVVQASAAQRIQDRDPAGTASALQQIEQTGRTALNEMRQVLGAIRTDPSESYHPARGLGSLQELVEEMARTGLKVSIVDDENGPDDPGDALPATVDLTAYRIVQESLTNVLKHGGRGATAEVRISRAPSALEVRITDNGRGSGATDSGGHGLRGMQERVEVFGGDFRAGPRPEGGFTVTAVLPVDGVGVSR